MFMAPEQHRGDRADARSDQFAFCVSLYHALYGAWPYEGKTAPALADAVIAGRLAPAPKGASVSTRLRKILLRGLATDPLQRYPAMQDLLADLEHDAKPRAKSRLPLWLGAALVVIAAGGAGAYAVLGSRGKPDKAVVRPTNPPTETTAVTSETGIAWLSTAIDKGRLDDAIEKYDLAADLKASEPVQAAIAKSAGAYVRVLRGNLEAAEAKLQEAIPRAGTDRVAKAYIDLAEAALAYARGELLDAHDRSGSCAKQLETSAPALAAICYEIRGEAQASLGDGAAARTSYAAGLQVAKGIPERTSTLRLALALLDLDEQKTASATQTATAVQAECNDRDALGCEIQARIVLARIRLGESAAQTALELLTGLRPSTIETFGVRIAHEIALGEVNGYMDEVGDDNLTGLDRIEKARSLAERQGLVVLTLEARLARLRVLLVRDDPDAKAYYADTMRLARAAKVERIARLAEAAFTELAGAPRDMLPADGGLPDVRPGSSGP
jgi:tetratricopeptide (TPR) repeat protein